MSILEQVSESEATGEIAAIYGEDAGSLGYVAAHTKVLALHPESASMTDADALALRAEGFTDPEIVEIALAAAARNYLSRALQALGADVDVPPGLSATLTSALLDPLP